MRFDWRIRRRQLHFNQEHVEGPTKRTTLNAGSISEVRGFPVVKVHAVSLGPMRSGGVD